MEFLASDALGGRGSGTRDELIAATYIASELRRYGIAPAGDANDYLQKAPARRRRQRDANATPAEQAFTYNVVGRLQGSDAQLSKEAILLSAHLDHLGTGEAVNGDNIYNGADDDASGVCAVLELARVLGTSKPKRTVIFALFGSEETGGAGNAYFLENSPVTLASFVANLEFEMIGRPDKSVATHTLWLTGYERSNLGPELARQGARLVADPHPEQNFFQRSDNYALARRGVIAHTVSSFGLHAEYHQPSDDIAHIDFAHMTDAIGSMFKPVLWLVNSNFKPQWVAGKQP
ncbi:MAG: M20/M25/M40 family metallo-hydrolase [Pyrinomonadaceae bacterium]|nr:M20/M25/M40 family metallo-hydrolase [Pyrinomonadaceae bacterium]